jgi:hypothetical protein
VSDEREPRALAYIRGCISFIERDVRIVMNSLPPLKAAVEAELAALARDR